MLGPPAYPGVWSASKRRCVHFHGGVAEPCAYGVHLGIVQDRAPTRLRSGLNRPTPSTGCSAELPRGRATWGSLSRAWGGQCKTPDRDPRPNFEAVASRTNPRCLRRPFGGVGVGPTPLTNGRRL